MLRMLNYILAIFLMIALAAAPWIDGEFFKRKFLHVADIINQENRVKIEVLDYQQGWLNSSAKLRVTLIENGVTAPYRVATQKKSQPVTFIVEQDISHGPLIYDPLSQRFGVGYANIHSLVHAPQELAAAMIETSTLAQFNGDWLGEIRMPKMVANSPLMNMEWDGLNGDYKLVVIQDDLRNLKINLHVGTITVNFGAQNNYVKQLWIEPISYTNDTARTRNGLWSGNANLATQAIRIKKFDGSLISVEGLTLSTSYGISGATFYNTAMIFNLYNLKLMHPLIPNTKLLHLKISASNFNAEGLNEYIQFFKSSTTEAINNMSMETIETLLAHTVMKNSSITGEGKADTDIGMIELRSLTEWDSTAEQPDTLAEILNTANTRIYVKASPQITKKIILEYKNNFAKPPEAISRVPNQAPLTVDGMVDGLTRIGYIVKNEDSYSTVFTINNGDLKINGRQLSKQ